MKNNHSVLLILVLGLFSMNAFGADQKSNSDNPWKSMDRNLRDLYSKLVMPDQQKKAEIKSQLNKDLLALKTDSAFHCTAPYRYALLKKAGFIAQVDAEVREKNLNCTGHSVIPVASTDASVIGKPFFFTTLDPSHIQGIKVGKSKNGSFNFGHSYIVLEICKDGNSCPKPLEIAIHPGMDRKGNIFIGARTYTDLLAAVHKNKDHSIEEVALTFNPEEKKAFLAALYERMQKEDARYSVLGNNCSTNVDQLIQFARFESKDHKVTVTPDGVLTSTAKQFGQPRLKPESNSEKSKQLLKQLGLKMKFSDYANLPPQERFCSSQNENGLPRIMRNSTNQGSDEFETHSTVKSLADIGHAGSVSERSGTLCKDARKKALNALNTITQCEDLENRVLFDKKVSLNKKLREPEPDKKFTELKEKSDQLANLREKLFGLLAKASHLVRTSDVPLSREEYLKRLLDLDHTDAGKELAKEISNLTQEIQARSTSVNALYSETLKEHSHVDPPSSNLMKYKELLKDSFLSHCNSDQTCSLSAAP